MEIKEKSVILKIKFLFKVLNNNKFFKGLKNIMLLSAVFHMIMITVYSITKSNTVKFNFFDILDLDLFFPKIASGIISQISSIFTFVIFYSLIVFLISLRRRKLNKRITVMKN